MSKFQSDYDILEGLNGLADISASLNRDYEQHEALNLKMLEKCESHRKAVQTILEITAGKSEAKLRDAVRAARWEYREQAFVLTEASRLLAAMAVKMNSISESMAKMVATDEE